MATAIPGTSKALRDRSTRLSIAAGLRGVSEAHISEPRGPAPPEFNGWERAPRQIDKGNRNARKIFMAVSFGSKYKENHNPLIYRDLAAPKH